MRMKPYQALFLFLLMSGSWLLGGVLLAQSGSPPAPLPSNSKPQEARYFDRDIMPMLSRLGCNTVACHGGFAGKGGLVLSLFAGAPLEDYETLVKAERAGRINRMDPAKSLLLLKVTGTIPHGGGSQVKPDSADYKTLLAWIEQGAPYQDDKLPKLIALRTDPSEQVVQKGQSVPVRVTAVYSDASEQDVTRFASFRCNAKDVASVDAAGKVKAEDAGMAPIVATYLRKSAVTRILVPQPLSTPFPTVTPNNKIDELVLANLKTLGLPPAELAPDDMFLRRVYLDVLGVLPTPEETRTFLADTDPAKRAKLIDRLLNREEFVEFWSLKWADLLRIKAEDPISLWPKGAETYYQWVYTSLAQNKPYDQFARELLTGSGSDFRCGPANFFRAVQKRDPRTFGESAALVFMGARLMCARCHGHPKESWGMDDDLGMGAFFAQMRFKMTGEWKEEIVFRDPDRQLHHPRTGEVVQAKPLGGAPVDLDPAGDPRRKFADWLTAPENPWFARNITNRIWFWLLERGIIHEPDDIRSTNPPENPALLKYLEDELVSHKYDLKHIYRLILNSRTYQQSSVPNPLSKKDEIHFSHYLTKRLSAEQLLDALSQVTEVPTGNFGRYERGTLAPRTTVPNDVKAAEVSDGSADNPTAAMFGRPLRATGLESERSEDIGREHLSFLASSGQVQSAINSSPRLQRLLKAKKSDAEIVEELYLAALSRFPTEAEKRKLTEYLTQNQKNRSGSLQNVLWAVLNTNDFLLNQ